MAFSISASSFESHLNCSICMEVFSDPRALPCMHTFCKGCLQSYITSLNRKTDVTSRGFECPVCRSATYSPAKGLSLEEWAENFTPNYTVKGLVDEHNETASIENGHVGVRQNDKHMTDVHLCGVHQEKVAEFKCEDHSPVQVLCSLCAVRKHKRCRSLIYIGDEHLSSSEDEDMTVNGDIDLALPVTRHRALSRRAHIKLCEAQEENRNNNEKVTENLSHRHSNICHQETNENAHGLSNPNSHKSLRRLFKSQHSHSFEDCEDLRKLSASAVASAPPYELIQGQNSEHFGFYHNSGDCSSSDPSLDMSAYLRDDHDERSQAQASREFVPEQVDDNRDSHPSLRRLARGPTTHTFNDNDDLKRLSAKHNGKGRHGNTETRLGGCLLLETATGRTNATKTRTRSALKKEMSVITETAEEELAFSSTSNPTTDKHSDVTLSMKSSFTMSAEINIRMAEDSKVCCVTGICSMPDGRVLLADYNNYKVKLFDFMGTFKTYITLPSEPWDIDCIGDYEAVVTLPNAMCMFTLIVDSKVTVGRRIDINRKCYGVVFHDMNFIIACVSDVRIFSYNGEFVTRILKDKKTIFKNPRSVNSNMRYLCIDKMDSSKLYVSDHNRGLVCAAINGEVLSFHSSPDSVSLQGIISSQSGILVVCQAPNSVTLFLINEHGCCTRDVLNVDNVKNADFNKSDGRLWLSTSESDMINIHTFKI